MRDLRDAVSFHQLVLASDGASAYTQRQYLYYEAKFIAWLEHKSYGVGLDQLTTTRAREFLLWYRNQPGPHRSRGGEVAVRAGSDILKRLGQVLEDNEYFEVNPLRKLPRPKVARFTRTPFTPTELNALWGASLRTRHGARDEALFLLLLDTGMRIGEACTLTMDNLSLERRECIVHGKGRRDRLVPFGDSTKKDGGRVCRALRRWTNQRAADLGERAADIAWVFTSRDGFHLTARGGNDVIKRIAAAGHVQDAYPHRLRHCFCTHYLTVHPGDELGLRRIVGHLSKNVLADYVHLSQTTIARRAGQASIAESLLG
jgi:site-specific recombinase XerD